LGLLLPSDQKLTLSLLATVTLEVVPFLAYASFPMLPTFFKCILGVVFYEVVKRRVQFSFDHFNCVKMAVSTSIWETEKSMVGGGLAVILALAKHLLMKKEV
jgi:hypothetical protein